VAEGEAEIVAMTANASVFAKCIVSVTTPTVTKVTISGDTAVDVDSTIQLNAAVTMSDGSTYNGTITWASSNTAKATVDSTGKVTGVAGAVSVKITATAGGVTGEYTISVTEKMTQMGSISYITTSVNKTVGDEAFTNPLTNTGDGVVTYSSSDSNIAQVNSTTGLVTIGTTAGSATITATVADSDTYTYNVKTASYTVNVIQQEEEIPEELAGDESKDKTITLRVSAEDDADGKVLAYYFTELFYALNSNRDDSISYYRDINTNNVKVTVPDNCTLLISYGGSPYQIEDSIWDMVAVNNDSAIDGFGDMVFNTDDLVDGMVIDIRFIKKTLEPRLIVTPSQFDVFVGRGYPISFSVTNYSGGIAGRQITDSSRLVMAPAIISENKATIKAGYKTGSTTLTVSVRLDDGTTLTESVAVNVVPDWTDLGLESGNLWTIAPQGAVGVNKFGRTYTWADIQDASDAQVTIDGTTYQYSIPTKADLEELLNSTTQSAVAQPSGNIITLSNGGRSISLIAEYQDGVVFWSGDENGNQAYGLQLGAATVDGVYLFDKTATLHLLQVLKKV
jgi:uncharacterized protein YjdB